MSKLIGNRYLVGLVLFLNLPGFANSVSGTVTSSAKITVRAFKYTPISPETWEAAQNVATRIFDRTGIETVWLDCSLTADGQHLLPDCALPATPTDIILRLVPTSHGDPSTLWRCNVGYCRTIRKEHDGECQRLL